MQGPQRLPLSFVCQQTRPSLHERGNGQQGSLLPPQRRQCGGAGSGMSLAQVKSGLHWSPQHGWFSSPHGLTASASPGEPLDPSDALPPAEPSPPPDPARPASFEGALRPPQPRSRAASPSAALHTVIRFCIVCPNRDVAGAPLSTDGVGTAALRCACLLTAMFSLVGSAISVVSIALHWIFDEYRGPTPRPPCGAADTLEHQRVRAQ